MEIIKGPYPPIADLLDKEHTPHPERLIVPPDEIIRSSGTGVVYYGRAPFAELSKLANGGLVLDVGCNTHIQRGNPRSIVGNLPNGYGIDPGFFRFSNPCPERAIAGYAEDMGFIDNCFRLVYSFRAVGYYVGRTINPYWALYEMIRVCVPGGLVNIQMGSGGGTDFKLNVKRILEAIEKIKMEPLGKKIGEVLDWSGMKDPQIVIQL